MDPEGPVRGQAMGQGKTSCPQIEAERGLDRGGDIGGFMREGLSFEG